MVRMWWNYQSIAVSTGVTMSKRRRKDGNKKRRGKRVENDTRFVCEIHGCHFVLTGITNFKNERGVKEDFPITECPKCIIANERNRREDKARVKWIRKLLTPDYDAWRDTLSGSYVFDEGTEEMVIDEETPSPPDVEVTDVISDEEFDKLLSEIDDI